MTRLRRRVATLLVVFGLLPAVLLALVWAAVYIVTGDSPLDLLEGIGNQRMIDQPMPPRPGGESSADSLLRPQAPEHAAPPAEPPKQEAPPPPESADKNPAPAKTPPIEEPPAPPGGDPLATPAFAKLPDRRDLKPLAAPYPLPELLKNGPAGPLPVATAGKEPRNAYARPFTGSSTTPRVAVVVVGLGLSKEATEAAILKLPPEVTLSFSPYAADLDGWIKRARAAGHEVMLDLPLQPPNFPSRDSGTLSILASDTPPEAVSRLETVLGKTTGYVGLAGSLHSPVTAGPQWPILLRAIKSHGLLYLGDGLDGAAPDDAPASAGVTLVPDELPFRTAIDARLARLLSAAQRDQSALAYVLPLPVTMERLLAWFDSLPQRGVVLAPASAVVRPRTGQTASP